MDFSAIGSSLGTALGAELPRILGAIVILIIGWILAVFARAGVRRLLAMAQLNTRVAETTEQQMDLESGLSAGAFWLIVLITLIGVFNSLDLALASGPFEVLVKQIAAYLPRLVAGCCSCSSPGSPRSRCAPSSTACSTPAGWTKRSPPAPACSRCARASATCSSGW